MLQRYTQSGATVVFSSHVMDLVERLCTRIGIMTAGRLIVEASPEELRERFDVVTMEDAFLRAVGAAETESGLEWLRASSG